MNLKARIFLILFFLSFVLSACLNYSKINVSYFGGLYKSVSVDVIYSENKNLELIDIANSKLYTLKIDENHYLYKTSAFKKVEKINIKNPEKIKQIIVYVDKKAQFNNFDKIDNTKNFLDRFSIITLSFFYNFYLYLFSYLFLFLFLYNFKGKISSKFIFWIILTLAFLFRLSQMNSIPFWDDEIYVLKITANYSPLAELFLDPGNPPLYFILFKIYRIIFQNPLFFRFSSVITGSIFLFVFYFYIKRTLNTKTALIGLFFSSFSMILIYLSQEIRCYMLLALFGVLTSYFLFKKNKKWYLITSICLLYTHFYGAFYYLANCLFSLFCFNKKERKSYFILNIIAGLSFIPCVLFKLQSITSNFNSWIKPPQLTDIIQTADLFSGYFLLFIIFVAFAVFAYKKSSKRRKIFIFYNLGVIFAVFLFAFIFSYLVKPIFLYRYFYVVYPCYIALCAVLAKDIRLNLITFIAFVSFSAPTIQNLYCNHNLYLDFVNNNLDKTKTNYVFMTDTVEGYREFLNDNIKPVYVSVNTGINTINPSDYGIKKPCICYILNLYLDDEVYSQAKNIELYKTSLGVFVKLEY